MSNPQPARNIQDELPNAKDIISLGTSNFENRRVCDRRQGDRRVEDRRDSACEYEGETYSSLFKAGEALGISPSYLYLIKKRDSLTSSETIKKAIDIRNDINKGHKKPCVINGVTYASCAEALSAYNLPYITVSTRQKRYNLTFEEAVLWSNNKEDQYAELLYNNFSKDSVREDKGFDEATLTPAKREFVEFLKKDNYPIKYFTNGKKDTIIARVKKEFDDVRYVYCWMICEPEHIQFVVTDVFLKYDEQTEKTICDGINSLNRLHAGTKLWYTKLPENQILEVNVGNSFLITGRKHVDVQTGLKRFYTLLKTSELLMSEYAEDYLNEG